MKLGGRCWRWILNVQLEWMGEDPLELVAARDEKTPTPVGRRFLQAEIGYDGRRLARGVPRGPATNTLQLAACPATSGLR